LVPTFGAKRQSVAVPADYLHWIKLEGNVFLDGIITCERTLMHGFTAESKQSSVPRDLHHLKN
jgi:hypothetical protein